MHDILKNILIDFQHAISNGRFITHLENYWPYKRFLGNALIGMPWLYRCISPQ